MAGIVATLSLPLFHMTDTFEFNSRSAFKNISAGTINGTSAAFISVNSPNELAPVTLCPNAILTLLKLPVKGATSSASSISFN